MERLITWLKAHVKDHHFILFWTVLNLIQIATTELTSDEAYYWFYASSLEWGYYDHPPLLAALIRAGTSLFSGEFGIRFFNVILMSAGLYCFLQTMKPQQKPYAYLILLALPLINFVTFIAFPDAALLGFAGMALYVYRRYLHRSDFKYVLILAVLLALMFYTKYHTILFVGFVVLSNPRLLRHWHLYAAAAIVVVLYLPHLWWEYNHDYVTFVYHLTQGRGAFVPKCLFEFVWQQLLVVGVGLLWVPFVRKADGQYEKTLKYLAIGTLVFFGLNACTRYVHIHWTSFALLPIVYLASNYYLSPERKRLFVFTVLPVIVVMLAIRLYLAVPIIPVNMLNVDYYRGRDLWAADIHTLAEGRPVIYETGHSGLREAALYSYYSGGESMALYPGEKKRSQYQIWNFEDRMQARPVFLVTGAIKGSRPLETRMGKVVHYQEIDHFVSYNNIELEHERPVDKANPQGRVLRLAIHNHRVAELSFLAGDMLFVELRGDAGRLFRVTTPLDGLRVESGGRTSIQLTLPEEDVPPGSYSFVAGFNNPYTHPSVNSSRANLTITP